MYLERLIERPAVRPEPTYHGSVAAALRAYRAAGGDADRTMDMLGPCLRAELAAMGYVVRR